MMSRYEIWYWERGAIYEYERDYGYGTFDGAVEMNMYDLTDYGQCLGGASSMEEASTLASQYFGLNYEMVSGAVHFWDKRNDIWY